MNTVGETSATEANISEKKIIEKEKERRGESPKGVNYPNANCQKHFCKKWGKDTKEGTKKDGMPHLLSWKVSSYLYFFLFMPFT